MRDLDEALQNERRLVEAIKRNSRRLTLPLLAVLVKTFALPVLALAVLSALNIFLRQLIERLLPGSPLSGTLYVVGLLVTFWLAYQVWRRSEKRFGGAALVRHLGQVTMAVMNVERAIDAARVKPAPTEDDLAAVAALSETAWTTYVEAMQAYGLQVEP